MKMKTRSQLRQLSDEELASPAFTPSLEIEDWTDRFVIRAGLPESWLEHIEVRFEDGVLSIRGEPDRVDSTVIRSASAHVRFYRRLSLVQSDAVPREGDCTGSDQRILEVVIPKAVPA